MRGDKNDLLAESQVFVRTIEEKKAEIDRIEGDLAATSGDDREALERRIAELAPDLIEDVHALAAHVVAWEEQGQDASASRDLMEDMLRRIASVIRRAVKRLDHHQRTEDLLQNDALSFDSLDFPGLL